MAFFKKLKQEGKIEESSAKKAKKAEEKPEKKIKVEGKEKMGAETIKKSLPEKEAKDWLKAEGQLAVDVYQADSEFCIHAPIAGVSPEDIEVFVENKMLVIKGERKTPEKDREKDYFYQECYWGPFSRQVILPEDVDISKIKAILKKGILTIKLPKKRKEKKKKVTVSEE